MGVVGGTHASTDTIEGRILGVHDSDTITLLNINKSQRKMGRS